MNKPDYNSLSEDVIVGPKSDAVNEGSSPGYSISALRKMILSKEESLSFLSRKLFAAWLILNSQERMRRLGPTIYYHINDEGVPLRHSDWRVNVIARAQSDLRSMYVLLSLRQRPTIFKPLAERSRDLFS